MSEKPGNTKEILTLEEVIAQRDEFLETIQTLDQLYKGDDKKEIKAEGSMSFTWRVPEGYHLEVSQSEGRPLYARTMFSGKESDTALSDEDLFDSANPLIAHTVQAYSHSYEDYPPRYHFRSLLEGPTYQLFSVFGDKLDKLNIQPVANKH